jgi:hypothetical protein
MEPIGKRFKVNYNVEANIKLETDILEDFWKYLTEKKEW